MAFRQFRPLLSVLVGATIVGFLGGASPPPDYAEAYTYALRCFAVTSSYGDRDGARKAFDAAVKLGQLQNLSNRQVNADVATWTANEQVKTVRDSNYKAQLFAECRKLGLAS